MNLENYQPKSELIRKSTYLTTARYAAIDAHNHLGSEFGGDWVNKPLSMLLENLDKAGIKKYIDLDGGWGEDILNFHLAKFKEPAPEKFQVFGGVDWSLWEEKKDKFGEWAAHRLEIQKQRGAQGLKIWKNLGLRVKDHNGMLVRPCDERLTPIWETAGALNLPVVIHLADPVAFFKPVDKTNERWEELTKHPDWQFNNSQYPTFSHIIQDFHKLVEDNPNTTFIGAHVGCYAENLDWVSSFLDQCPNLHIDISARIGELGRQPYRAREFFLKYADRILFGSDMGPDVEAYRIMYRFLETSDEYFNYSASEIPQQGRWYIYGINLPDEVLKKIYYQNAEKILQKD